MCSRSMSPPSSRPLPRRTGSLEAAASVFSRSRAATTDSGTRRHLQHSTLPQRSHASFSLTRPGGLDGSSCLISGPSPSSSLITGIECVPFLAGGALDSASMDWSPLSPRLDPCTLPLGTSAAGMNVRSGSSSSPSSPPGHSVCTRLSEYHSCEPSSCKMRCLHPPREDFMS